VTGDFPYDSDSIVIGIEHFLGLFFKVSQDSIFISRGAVTGFLKNIPKQVMDFSCLNIVLQFSLLQKSSNIPILLRHFVRKWY